MYMISDCTCMSMDAHFVNICVVNIDFEMDWAWNLCTSNDYITGFKTLGNYLRQGGCNRRCTSVCLSVSNFAQKLRNGFAWYFQRRLTMGQWTIGLNFGGDPDHRLDTGIVFRIHHYWDITESGQWTFIHTDSPDGGAGKTSLCGGINCPSASSIVRRLLQLDFKARSLRICSCERSLAVELN